MRFGICVYKDDIPAAERAGYDYVELTVTNVLPEVEDSEFNKLKEQLKPYRIRPEAWRRFIPPNLPVAGPEVDISAITEFLKITLGKIRELGGEVVVFGSPLSRKIPSLNEPRAINTILPDYPTGEFLRSLYNIGYDHRLSIEDLDRNFMNLEREAPLVLSHVKKVWEGLSA